MKWQVFSAARSRSTARSHAVKGRDDVEMEALRLCQMNHALAARELGNRAGRLSQGSEEVQALVAGFPEGIGRRRRFAKRRMISLEEAAVGLEAEAREIRRRDEQVLRACLADGVKHGLVRRGGKTQIAPRIAQAGEIAVEAHRVEAEHEQHDHLRARRVDGGKDL